MHCERASEDVYIFTSERYAQVTASLIVSGGTGILIDTLPFPSETLQIALLARKRCPNGVRFIIYTGHEADHVYGAFLFPKAEIIAHDLTREILRERGFAALEKAKEQSPELGPVKLRLPTFTFASNSIMLRLPGKTLEIFHTPGHSADCLSVLLHEERLLFAGDTVMGLPSIVNGDPEQLKKSLEKISTLSLESIIQGHGEIILRGEIKDSLRRQINYIDSLHNKIQKLIEGGGTRDDARAITIEQCGLSRVLLGGVAVQLHTANVLATYDRLMAQQQSSQPARKRTSVEKQRAKQSTSAQQKKRKASAAQSKHTTSKSKATTTSRKRKQQ
jgi:glyoxylase-like metal-dependent hydrolase (beta-lactamase superfamily II)